MGSSSPDRRGGFRDRLHQDVDAVVRELRDGRETSERAVARLLFLAEAYAAQRVALAPHDGAGPAEVGRRAVERVIPIALATDEPVDDARGPRGDRAIGRPRPVARRRAHAAGRRDADLA